MKMPDRRRYLLVLASAFSLFWLAMAVAPVNRHDWMLENTLVVLFGIALWSVRRYFVFSRVSYTLIFVYLSLHTVGAHYTYSEVPYDAWWQALTGSRFNPMFGWERNHFDRLVHFSYGLLLAYPIREVFLRVAQVRGFWGYFLPLDFTLSTSALFELLEWLAVSLVASDLGAAYLGTQGDVWDAHKDMALAGLGALIAMLITAALNSALQRDFAREWAESLRIKDQRPLGEDEIARMLAENQAGDR